ncbi:hypothetical protein M1N82_00360 [Dehalococcoidia bacterium]|nr:hypothetical protein [Dehalococcoidia bacterium]
MKDRSVEPRSYEGKLMEIGEPGERYIKSYLERHYVKVVPVGKERKRRDYRCFSESNKVELVEGKTDTMIALTKRIPWEAFRIENSGARAYISWGYTNQASRVVFFVPQWLKILDVYSLDIRRLIFAHLMAKRREIYLAHTLTDEDRITFFFAVPLNLLREAGYLKETDIAELPLTPEVPQQVTMNV